MLCMIVGEWEVKVKTSDLHNAGTHAQIYVTVYGTQGMSDKLEVGQSGPKCEDFEQGKESTFDVSNIYFA